VPIQGSRRLDRATVRSGRSRRPSPVRLSVKKPPPGQQRQPRLPFHAERAPNLRDSERRQRRRAHAREGGECRCRRKSMEGIDTGLDCPAGGKKKENSGKIEEGSRRCVNARLSARRRRAPARSATGLVINKAERKAIDRFPCDR
jgi:hypothetical protein